MVAPNIGVRTASACLFVPLILGLSWTGGWALFTLVFFIVWRGMWELYQVARATGHRPAVKTSITGGLCWILALQFEIGSQWLLPLILCLVMTSHLVCMRSGTDRFLGNAAVTLGGFVYVGLGGSTPLLVVAHGVQEQWAEPTALVVVVFASIWMSDAAAYLYGHAFGNRKLAPSISPGKTVGGFVAGIAGALLPLALHKFLPLTLIELALLLLLTGVVGQLGDLAESALKRDAGLKDAPGLIPGHGGVLDRFDSYLFAFPVCYVYLKLVSAH